MKNDSVSKKLALIGGGPAALYLFKNLVDGGNNNYHIHIYERQSKLGAGMPYSKVGASYEHVTNISDTEIPELEMSVEEWLKIAPSHLLHEYQITPENFNELKVMPRLLFGEYLCAQFEMLCKRAASLGFTFSIDFNTAVKDIIEKERENCRLIGKHGLKLIEAISKKKKNKPVNILTHCNAGWLATLGYGTATAPVYMAHEKGIPVHVWVDETRPLNQGARLTAW